jgi:hypothetical protein
LPRRAVSIDLTLDPQLVRSFDDKRNVGRITPKNRFIENVFFESRGARNA